MDKEPITLKTETSIKAIFRMGLLTDSAVFIGKVALISREVL